MFKPNSIKWLFIFIITGLFIMSSGIVKGSSNPYYIGPSGDIEGVVADDSGSPVSGANIYYTAGDGNMWYGFYYAVSDEQGKFSITNVIPGSGTLTANAKWYNEGKAENVEVTENSITEQDVVLTLVDTGTISGTVTKTNSSTEDPIAGITVSAFPTYYFPEMMKDGKMSGGMKDMSIVKKDNGLAMQRINPSKIKKEKARIDKKHRGKGKKKPTKEEEKATQSFAGLFFPNYYMYESITPAITDSEGKYSFENLPKGNYSIYIDLEAKSGFERPKEQYIEVLGNDAQEIDFKLSPLKTGSVSGRVINPINPKENPVSGAMVDIYNDTFYGYTVTDADGNYSMLSVPKGEYQISSFSQYSWIASKLYSVSVEEGKNSVVEDIKFKEYEYIMPDEGEDTGGDGDFMDMGKDKMKEKNMGM
ncbi:MAG: hypothetical protein A3C43_04350 [Candidatus Schekmanbacteria bacterium RIFCSPHIGHO2_02_FULL_38_11]|uniref:Carboxypeptidase regulatory-like domain-containing protein n=1 Tax=Candidatus Schekmanbacteria bacterium RIFCSPLOWO2_12_FULL_38_15 TaxID=1817883 RepID=A0A1F7SM44_9BACT|nr:MAG: hypothetical protein A2043_01300 [Candidatus Schekmanbacteria bacterium GWA2_38_9]OGL48784.1 MAG: hypothetical protein A3C43_04350 [Candidatus Schekmanbacteria bacterium RIFCSPHIGHO2_02_FULL_38_11]OGL51021.1 MAG: hypothetical protein A3H37_11130 [Candidatus Schekmanbacteria bacterium RIFCSPLOWO2_02_FULL_38_14]OGL54850.1 MAG: hypothetical protein A3G31_01880 [Candidatus Schekmanbacteria bacterium RIFCSPLOWO2_12_FULL_38_15]